MRIFSECLASAAHKLLQLRCRRTMRQIKFLHSLPNLVHRRRITLIITLSHDNAAKSPRHVGGEDFAEEVNARMGM